MSGDLAAFWAARLDEDEAAANAARAGPWRYDGSAVIAATGLNVTPAGAHHSIHEDDAAHIARHDPARVLREVAADRRIMDRHTPRLLDRWQVCSNCRPVDPEYPSDLTSVPW